MGEEEEGEEEEETERWEIRESEISRSFVFSFSFTWIISWRVVFLASSCFVFSFHPMATFSPWEVGGKMRVKTRNFGKGKS